MNSLKEPIIAECYLRPTKGAQESIYFTPFWLHVNQKNKQWRIDINNIKSIRIDHYKITGALILGGILSCFSVIMMSTWSINPYLLLTTFILGLLLIYYGVSGAPVIVIHEVNDVTIVYLKELPEGLKDFIKFFKKYLGPKDDIMRIYHIANENEWEGKSLMYHHPSLDNEGFIHASPKEEVLTSFLKYFSNEGDYMLLVIDTLKVTNKVIYEFVEERGVSFPHIYGELNKSAVQVAIKFNDEKELNEILNQLT